MVTIIAMSRNKVLDTQKKKTWIGHIRHVLLERNVKVSWYSKFICNMKSANSKNQTYTLL